MLRTCAKEDKQDIVSWLSHGKAFKVHNVPVFVSEILPLYFNQTKYKSFQRQLNLWGFDRILSGSEKGAYEHIQFLREKPNLCHKLTRERAKKVSPLSSLKKTKRTFIRKKMPKTRLVSPFPPRYGRIPRTVSEGSLQGVEELLGSIDADEHSDNSLDQANFDGITFYLLEKGRYEELNLEFDFFIPSENEIRSNKKNVLLEELELGLFGIPKMDFDAFSKDS